MSKLLFVLLASFACACGSAAKSSQTGPQTDLFLMTAAYDDAVSVSARIPGDGWKAFVNRDVQKSSANLVLKRAKPPGVEMVLFAFSGAGRTEEQVAESFRLTDEEAAEVKIVQGPIVTARGHSVFTLEMTHAGAPTRMVYDVFRLDEDLDIIGAAYLIAPADAWSAIEPEFRAFIGSVQVHAP